MAVWLPATTAATTACTRYTGVTCSAILMHYFTLERPPSKRSRPVFGSTNPGSLTSGLFASTSARSTCQDDTLTKMIGRVGRKMCYWRNDSWFTNTPLTTTAAQSPNAPYSPVLNGSHLFTKGNGIGLSDGTLLLTTGNRLLLSNGSEAIVFLSLL